MAIENSLALADKLSRYHDLETALIANPDRRLSAAPISCAKAWRSATARLVGESWSTTPKATHAMLETVAQPL